MLPIPGPNTSKSLIRGAIRLASANGRALLIFGDSTWPSSGAKVSRLNSPVPVKSDFANERRKKETNERKTDSNDRRCHGNTGQQAVR